MKPGTKEDMMYLQTYGAFYLSGIEPVNIEAMLRSDDMQFDALENALGIAAGEDAIRGEMERSAAIVEVVFNTVAVILQAVGGATMGITSAIGAVFSIVGGIISAVLRHQATVECDDADCLDADPGTKKEWRHIRATVGVMTSSDVEFLDDHTCRIEHYGGTKSQCEARWGYFSTYMNDGMWWWGKEDPDKHMDCLRGTTIGVKGRVDSGETAGCHRRMYGNPETPILEGMSGKPSNDGDLSPEFLGRQEAVTQVLIWLAYKMDYSILSCFEELFHRYQGTSEYIICPQSLLGDDCKEQSIAHFMGAPNDMHSFGTSAWAPNHKVASRIYASIRSMFQGTVAMCKRLTESGKREDKIAVYDLLWRAGVRPSADRGLAINVHTLIPTDDIIGRAIEAQKKNEDPWPEKILADHLTWRQLRDFHWLLGRAITEKIIQDKIDFEATRQRAIAAAEAATAAHQARPLGIGEGIEFAQVVRKRMAELAVNPRTLGAGGFGQFAPIYLRVPSWAIYGGAAAFALSGVVLLVKAFTEED